MTYIILRDTFGNGLETISNIGLDVIEEHQLDQYICDAAGIIANEDYRSVSDYNDDGNPSMGKVLVICKIVGELKGKNIDDYILDVLKKQEEKRNREEYDLYLELKKKFEK